MFGLHWQELALVVIVGLLFFGPKRLPEIGSSVGKTIKEFQRSLKEVTEPNNNNNAAVTPPPAAPAQQIPAAPMATVASAEPPTAAVSESPVATAEHKND